MKRKFLVAMLAMASALCLAFGLSACGLGRNVGENGGHTHTYATEWTSDETYHWHAATCEHTDKISGKAEHNFVDGNCSVCGYEKEKPASEGLKLTLSSGETFYIVTGIGTCTDIDLVIPSEYKNLPVKEIDDFAY